MARITNEKRDSAGMTRTQRIQRYVSTHSAHSLATLLVAMEDAMEDAMENSWEVMFDIIAAQEDDVQARRQRALAG